MGGRGDGLGTARLIGVIIVLLGLALLISRPEMWETGGPSSGLPTTDLNGLTSKGWVYGAAAGACIPDVDSEPRSARTSRKAQPQPKY